MNESCWISARSITVAPNGSLDSRMAYDIEYSFKYTFVLQAQ